jgi:hypothetical protein
MAAFLAVLTVPLKALAGAGKAMGSAAKSTASATASTARSAGSTVKSAAQTTRQTVHTARQVHKGMRQLKSRSREDSPQEAFIEKLSIARMSVAGPAPRGASMGMASASLKMRVAPVAQSLTHRLKAAVPKSAPQPGTPSMVHSAMGKGPKQPALA